MGTLQSKLLLIIIVAPWKLYSEQANRGQGIQIFGSFWPLPTGHVAQRMRNGIFFARKRFTMGTLQSQLPLIIVVGPWKLYSEEANRG